MKRESLCIGLFSAVLVASPVAAQRPDTARADSAAARRPVALAPVIVTASRLALPADRVGFAVSLLTREELAARRPLYAVDALRTLAGAYVDEAAGPGGPTIIRLRGGEEVFTQILLDGVQLNQTGGFFDFQGLMLGNLERIEVARGPQSALYGSSAVSGVVQFLTQRGETGPLRIEATTERGEATRFGGSNRTATSVTGGSQSFRYSAGVGSAFSRGVFERPHDTRTKDYSARLDYLPNARWSLTGLARRNGVDSKLPIRDPGATRVPLDPNARSERDRTVGSLTARHAGGRSTRELRASVYRDDFLYQDQRDDVPTAGLDFFLFDATFDYRDELTRTAVEYSETWQGRSRVGLAYGARYEREALDNSLSGEFGDAAERFERGSWAGFGELRATPFPRLDLLVGGRLEKFEGLEAEVTPRASAVLALVPDRLKLRLAGGRAYKAPNLQQQFPEANPFIASNPDLRPETSVSWDAGLDARAAEGRLSASVTYFSQRYEDLIRTVGQEGTEKQINRNLGESRAAGLEWSARWQAARRAALGLEGSWVETEVVDNAGLSEGEYPKGEALPFRPTSVSTGFLELAPTSRLSFALRGTRIGSQIVLTERFTGRRVELEPYFLAGLTANYDLRPNMGLYARVDNLFDTQYDVAFDRPGIPLTGAIGVRWGGK